MVKAMAPAPADARKQASGLMAWLDALGAVSGRSTSVSAAVCGGVDLDDVLMAADMPLRLRLCNHRHGWRFNLSSTWPAALRSTS
jgi:hypothetical protein